MNSRVSTFAVLVRLDEKCPVFPGETVRVLAREPLGMVLVEFCGVARWVAPQWVQSHELNGPAVAKVDVRTSGENQLYTEDVDEILRLMNRMEGQAREFVTSLPFDDRDAYLNLVDSTAQKHRRIIAKLRKLQR